MARNQSSQEETPRFTFAFMNKVAPVGRKVQSSSRPELVATSTKDKFTINEKARLLLNLSDTDKIFMVDQNLYIPAGTGDRLAQDKRFYIGVAPEGFKNAAVVGDTNAFSYSGIWSAMLMNDPEVTEASTADMVRNGLGILRGKAGKNYVGTKKVVWEVVPFVQENSDGTTTELFPLTPEMEEAGEGVKIYSLINPEFADHTPKSTGGKEEVAEEVEA